MKTLGYVIIKVKLVDHMTDIIALSEIKNGRRSGSIEGIQGARSESRPLPCEIAMD